MKDRFGRTIDYLRISVTDRCNLGCLYCIDAAGITLFKHEDILSLEEIVEVTDAAVSMGIKKVRLTGGEPLVRRGIVKLVEEIAKIEGIEDFSMTTNGILLSKYAKQLACAGLQRINVSLDTVDPFRYREFTRGGDVAQVFEGINAAREIGLEPVKINCVRSSLSTESDVQSVKSYGRDNGLDVRVIEQMNFQTGCFTIVQGGSGGDCQRCSRLRLSSDGKIRPCLFSDIYFEVRKLGIQEAIRLAVDCKPEAGGPCGHSAMHTIGG